MPEQLRRTPEERLWVKGRSSHESNRMHNQTIIKLSLNVFTSLNHSFFPTRLPIALVLKMMKNLVCRV